MSYHISIALALKIPGNKQHFTTADLIKGPTLQATLQAQTLPWQPPFWGLALSAG